MGLKPTDDSDREVGSQGGTRHGQAESEPAFPERPRRPASRSGQRHGHWPEAGGPQWATALAFTAGAAANKEGWLYSFLVSCFCCSPIAQPSEDLPAHLPPPAATRPRKARTALPAAARHREPRPHSHSVPHVTARNRAMPRPSTLYYIGKVTAAGGVWRGGAVRAAAKWA